MKQREKGYKLTSRKEQPLDIWFFTSSKNIMCMDLSYKIQPYKIQPSGKSKRKLHGEIKLGLINLSKYGVFLFFNSCDDQGYTITLLHSKL